jgi:hypothetical protein
MKTICLLSLLAACGTTDTNEQLSHSEQTLLGCWIGMQGDKQVTYRFKADHTVQNGIVGGTLYSGVFSLDGAALTMDFGEEPPTYQIIVTPAKLTFTDFPFEFKRCDD